MRNARGQDARRGSQFVIVFAAAAIAAGCREEAPAPSREPAVNTQEVIRRLTSLSADDAFFKDLDLLRAEAARSSDPALQDALTRTELNALAAGLASRAAWLPRLTGAEASDRSRIAAFLTASAKKLDARNPELAKDLLALAGMFDPSAVTVLTDTLEHAERNDAGAPALRAILAVGLLNALRGVVDAPESERGPLLMQAIPGWPNPPSSDPMQSAFPTALNRLSRLLSLAEGSEAALAPHFHALRAQAQEVFRDRVFPMPVVLEATPPAAVQVPGSPSTYSPILVSTLKGGEWKLGWRPLLAWSDAQVRDLAADRAWPGATIESGEALNRVQKPRIEAIAKQLEESQNAAADLEKRAYPQAETAWNSARQGRGKAMLWVVERAEVARRLDTALAVSTEAGFSDIRLVAPGSFFGVLPVFHRKVPEVPGVEPPKGGKVLVALSAEAAEVYPPAGCKVPGSGWPEGARVLQQAGAVTGVQVRWSEAGFQGRLSATLGRMREACRGGPFVPLIVRSGDLAAAVILAAAAEVLASPGTPFPSLPDYFPGLACAEGRPCASAIPILFAPDRVPKPTSAEAQVEVSRPAGFCDPKDVKRVMDGRAGAVRACYEMHLQRNPELAGRLEIRFTIEEDGSMSGLAVTANDLGTEVASCVLRQVSSLRFPKPAGGVCVIRWPYRFKPGG